MKSVTTERFRRCFENLPQSVQEQARRTYRQWKDNPNHPTLNYKQVHASQQIYSVRIVLHYRALAVQAEQTVIWFWIGSHEDYNNTVNQL